MKSLRVMIVDDSALTAKKIGAMLEDAGHIVAGVCESGNEAVDAYQDVKPDIVTMDITMLGMNGIEATKAILQQNNNALIIMVTAHGQEQMVIEAIEAGAKGYLLKPIKQDSLIQMISKVYEKYADD